MRATHPVLLIVCVAVLAQAQTKKDGDKPSSPPAPSSAKPVSSAPDVKKARESKAVIAEALFREAKKLLEAGDPERACPKLEASQATEPALGTLLLMGLCYERSGRIASAWTTFSMAASQAAGQSRADRERYARDRVATLEKQLHRVKFDATKLPENGVMMLDGQPLARDADTAVPLDPGSHSLVASAPGHEDWETTFAVPKDPGLDVIEIPELAPTEQPPPPPVAPKVAPKPKPKARLKPAPVEPKPIDANNQKSIGYVVGTVGVVSLGIAGFFAYRMLDEKSVRDDLCPPGRPCHDQRAVDADQSARSARTFAIGFGAAGVVGVGVGAWLAFGSSSPTSAAVTPNGKLVVTGRF